MDPGRNCPLEKGFFSLPATGDKPSHPTVVMLLFLSTATSQPGRKNISRTKVESYLFTKHYYTIAVQLKIMYCTNCSFKIDSYHHTICPNCHHTLPEKTQDSQQESTQPTPSSQPAPTPAAIPPDYRKELGIHAPKKSDNKWKWLILLLIIFLYIFPLTAPYVAPPIDEGLATVRDYWDEATTPYFLVPQKVSYIMERTICVEAEGGSGEFSLHFPDIPETPQENTTTWGAPFQKILNFETRIPQGESFVTESRNGGWIEYEGDLAKDQKVKIVFSYTVEAQTIRWDKRVDDSNSGTVADIPQELKDKYNHDEQFNKSGTYIDFIEMEKYRGLAQSITEGETTVYGQIKAIYDYVIDEVQYIRGRDPKPCSQTLENGYGDCDDMAVVFISLARSLGIPSWMSFGQLTNDKFISWGGHSWVEVYIPLQDGNHYVAHIDIANSLFLIYSPTRLFEWSDRGNAEELSHFYYYFSWNVPGQGTINIEQEMETKEFSISGSEKILVQ